MTKQQLKTIFARIRNGNAQAVEEAIRFLEKDEYRFGSGYAKEQIWRHLKHVPLLSSQQARLRHVARQYLHRRMEREFWDMCRFMASHGDEAFRQEVEQLARTGTGSVRKRASLLSAYLHGTDIGAKARRAFKAGALSGRFARP